MVKQTKNNQFGEVFAIGSEFLESLKAVRSARVRESHGRKTIKAIKIRTFRARAREGCNKGAKTCNKKTACFRLHQMHTSRTGARREPYASGRSAEVSAHLAQANVTFPKARECEHL